MRYQAYVRWFVRGITVGLVLAVPLHAIRRRRPKEHILLKKDFVLKSSAFANDGKIPEMYTCDGNDVSPPLRWDRIPEGTKSFAIICEDRDARGGTWVHWVVFNLPPSVTYLPVNANIEYYKGIEGANSWGSNDWGGPCPPMRQHRYVFTIYALRDKKLRLDKKATRRELLRAMRGKVLGQAQLMGTYKRPENR